MSQAQIPARPLPGPLACQGKAIAALLQEVFPPSLFQFKYLPAKLDKRAWTDIVQGNQPFLGLSFIGAKPTADTRPLQGTATWLVLCAVRATASPKVRFYGDGQGVGALDVGVVAATVLNGRVAATGSVTVAAITNAMAEEWSDDTAIIAVELRIPFVFPLYDAITRPQGLGIFEEMAETWNFPTGNGSQDVFTSDWENPNV